RSGRRIAGLVDRLRLLVIARALRRHLLPDSTRPCAEIRVLELRGGLARVKGAESVLCHDGPCPTVIGAVQEALGSLGDGEVATSPGASAIRCASVGLPFA